MRHDIHKKPPSPPGGQSKSIVGAATRREWSEKHMAIKKNYKNKASLDQNFIPKSGTFKFKCAECGECCRDIAPEDKVLMSTVDIYRIAKHLGMEMTDVIEKYCDMVPGGESMIPLIVMRDHLDTTCIFLKKGKCSIHEVKPIACSLHPLGRIDIFNEETDQNEFHYYLNEFDCAATRDEEVKVQDWLDRFGVEEYDDAFRLYKRMGSVCSKIMHALKTDAERREMFGMTFFMMYAKYDMQQDLLPQIAQNLAFVQSINPDIAFDKSKMA